MNRQTGRQICKWMDGQTERKADIRKVERKDRKKTDGQVDRKRVQNIITFMITIKISNKLSETTFQKNPIVNLKSSNVCKLIKLVI